MDHPVSYHQGCPICGRNLRIGVTLLGKPVYCQHCGGRFVATDSSATRDAAATQHDPHCRLDMVDALIERASVVLARTGDAAAGGRNPVAESQPATIAARRFQ